VLVGIDVGKVVGEIVTVGANVGRIVGKTVMIGSELAGFALVQLETNIKTKLINSTRNFDGDTIMFP